SVLPEPVGAQINVLAPEAIAGQPCACAGVGASKEAENQRRTGSEKGASGSDFALGLGDTVNRPSLRLRAAQPRARLRPRSPPAAPPLRRAARRRSAPGS